MFCATHSSGDVPRREEEMGWSGSDYEWEELREVKKHKINIALIWGIGREYCDYPCKEI